MALTAGPQRVVGPGALLHHLYSCRWLYYYYCTELQQMF